MYSLSRESLFRTLLLEECLATLMLSLDHIYDSFEPLRKKDGVLAAARFSQIRL